MGEFDRKPCPVVESINNVFPEIGVTATFMEFSFENATEPGLKKRLEPSMKTAVPARPMPCCF